MRTTATEDHVQRLDVELSQLRIQQQDTAGDLEILSHDIAVLERSGDAEALGEARTARREAVARQQGLARSITKIEADLAAARASLTQQLDGNARHMSPHNTLEEEVA